MLNGFFLIVLDFQSALDFLGFSDTGCLVSPVCDFGGFSRFGFGFLMDLGFYWFFSRTVIFQVGY
jgi:hypothetical protein